MYLEVLVNSPGIRGVNPDAVPNSDFLNSEATVAISDWQIPIAGHIYFRGPSVVIRLFFVRCVYYTLICCL